MGDILLIFPPDKKTAALEVEQALAKAGYRADPSPVTDGSRIAALAGGAGAALLIWSRGLALAATTEGWLGGLRRLSNLLELSTDGIAPQDGDESRVILLSGWRGQPFHLGWQRVLSELERLGAGRATVKAAASCAPIAAAPPAEAPRPEVARPKAGAAPTPNSAAATRKYALPVAAALALAGGIAAAVWVSDRSPLPPPTAQAPAPVAAAPAVPTPAPMATTQAAAPAAAAPMESLAPAPAQPRALVPEAVSRSSAGAPKQVQRPPTAKQVRSTPTRAAVRAEPRSVATKRYTKRGAKMMRRFCAGSGRQTPECRTFSASTDKARS
jgi:hypothetical protein